MRDYTHIEGALVKALQQLNKSRAAVLSHSRELRERGTAPPTCDDLGRAGVYQLGLSYAVDDLVALSVQVLDEARAPWWRRSGFLPGVFVGLSLAVGLLGLWLQLA